MPAYVLSRAIHHSIAQWVLRATDFSRIPDGAPLNSGREREGSADLIAIINGAIEPRVTNGRRDALSRARCTAFS